MMRMMMQVALMMSLKWIPPQSLVFLPMISGVVIAGTEWSVNYTQNSICAVRGSTVTVDCSYVYNATNSTVQEPFWSKKLDGSSATQRVPNVKITPRNCSLKLKDVTQDNQGKYFLTLRASDGKRFQSKEIEISVTGLRVEVIPDSVIEGNEVFLSCKTSCNLTSAPMFAWFKNGTLLPSVSSSNPLHLSSVSQEDVGDYRCAVQGQNYRSPAITFDVQGVVIAGTKWSVNYTQNSICAVRGSTVTVDCSYVYNATNSTVQDPFWSKKLDGSSATQRVPNVKITPRNCSLKLKDVTQDNQGKYFLTLRASDGKRFQSKEIEISVTGLRVEVIPDSVIEGNEVFLSCKTSCNLTSAPMFAWFKNGTPLPSVSSSNPLHLSSVSQEDVGDYRCAVQGQNYRSPAITFDVQERHRVFPLVIGIIIILVVAALLAGLYYMRRRRQKASDPVTSSLQLSQQNAAEDLYIPPDPISMSFDDTYSTLANIYSSPTDDSNAHMDHQARISSDTNDTFANDYYNPTDGTYMNLDLQAADKGSADDTYTALDLLSISPDYDTLTTVRNQQ